jgi:hypothetical protein
MRSLYDNIKLREEKIKNAYSLLTQNHSLEAVGKNYSRRLSELELI